MSIDPFAAAARQFLDTESARLPDFSACTLIIPHFHAASGFLGALHGLAGHAVLLPPRMLTLQALAAQYPLDAELDADCLRVAEIHDFLQRTGLFKTASLWAAAQELLRLLDELSASRLTPPASETAFLQQIAGDARVTLAKPLELEARLVYELWRAMQQGRRKDRLASLAAALHRASEHPPGPLYRFGLTRLSPLEEAFFARWAIHQPVYTLPAPAAHPDRWVLLNSAWSVDEDAPPMRDRAQATVRAYPLSPLVGRLQLRGADSLENEAACAATQVCQWVAAGKSRIGIVAYDRIAARRLRALLERRQLLVQDETGWTLSTTAASHVLDRLFALLQDDCYHRDLVDLLKSPFIFADVEAASRQRAVADLEHAIRRTATVSGFSRFLFLAEREAPAATPLLQRLATARTHLVGDKRPLSAWQDGLMAALEALGSQLALSADLAGQQLLDQLARLAEEARHHTRQYASHAWREWLSLQLENSLFSDDRIESPICLMPPLAARLRDLDGLILLGADAEHLPATPSRGLFSDRVRHDLGLPTQATAHAEARHVLMDLISQVPDILITWQARLSNDPNPPSPWLELLAGFHQLAYGSAIKTLTQSPRPATESADLQPAMRPAPRCQGLPGKLSASAWQRLVNCPYQYFAHHVLGLGELEEVPEEMEKRDYGEVVHAILNTFHRRHPRLADHDRTTLLEALTAISDTHFLHRRQQTYLALGWQLRWEKHLPGYIDWALAHETRGHLWQAGEVARERALPYATTKEILLYGRIDRVDRTPDGELVIDYKTRARQALRSRMKQPGEDVQLTFYGLLTGAREAAYLALDDAQIDLLPHAALDKACTLEEARIRDTFDRLAEGAVMPAQGVASLCDVCSMRGLCRRDYWI